MLQVTGKPLVHYFVSCHATQHTATLDTYPEFSAYADRVGDEPSLKGPRPRHPVDTEFQSQAC